MPDGSAVKSPNGESTGTMGGNVRGKRERCRFRSQRVKAPKACGLRRALKRKRELGWSLAEEPYHSIAQEKKDVEFKLGREDERP